MILDNNQSVVCPIHLICVGVKLATQLFARNLGVLMIKNSLNEQDCHGKTINLFVFFQLRPIFSMKKPIYLSRKHFKNIFKKDQVLISASMEKKLSTCTNYLCSALTSLVTQIKFSSVHLWHPEKFNKIGLFLWDQKVLTYLLMVKISDRIKIFEFCWSSLRVCDSND